MAKQSRSQQATVGRVMHEFKRGKLKSGSGDKVTDPKQAIAIGLSEAGASDRQSPAENKRRENRTRRRERGEGPTRAELYAKAKQQDVPGRSKMSKAELEKALNA